MFNSFNINLICSTGQLQEPNDRLLLDDDSGELSPIVHLPYDELYLFHLIESNADHISFGWICCRNILHGSLLQVLSHPTSEAHTSGHSVRPNGSLSRTRRSHALQQPIQCQSTKLVERP